MKELDIDFKEFLKIANEQFISITESMTPLHWGCFAIFMLGMSVMFLRGKPVQGV